MKVLSHRLDTATSKPGLVVIVNEALRTNTSSVTPAGRHAQRLLLEKFRQIWPQAQRGDPELLGVNEIFLPSLKASALPRVKAALKKSYNFSKRTVSQSKTGLVTIQSPHPFLWHDVVCITTMAGTKQVRYADETSRMAIVFMLSGKRTFDATVKEIDNYMK